MEFGIDKSATLSIKRGKIVQRDTITTWKNHEIFEIERERTINILVFYGPMKGNIVKSKKRLKENISDVQGKFLAPK